MNEKMQEIFDALKVAAEVAKRPILEVELRAMAGRLEEFHTPELFRLIASLPGRSFFPAGVQIEDEIKKILGLAPPPKSSVFRAEKRGPPDEGLIEKHEREAVVAGQKPSQARAGAELMRKSKEEAERRRMAREAKKNPRPTQDLREFVDSVIANDKIRAEPIVMKEETFDALSALENFDTETQNILDELDSF